MKTRPLHGRTDVAANPNPLDKRNHFKQTVGID